MVRGKGLVVCLVVAVSSMLVMLTFWLGRGRLVASDGHHLGLIHPGKRIETSITLRNPGWRGVRIDKVISSCGCTVVGSAPTRLEGGETVEIPLRIKVPASSRDFAAEVAIVASDSKTPHVVKIHGENTALWKLSQQIVGLGSVQPGGSVGGISEVELTGGEELDLIASASVSWLSAKVSRDKDGKLGVELQVASNAPRGEFDETVAVFERENRDAASEIYIRGVVEVGMKVRPMRFFFSAPSGSEVTASRMKRVELTSLSSEWGTFEVLVSHPETMQVALGRRAANRATLDLFLSGSPRSGEKLAVTLVNERGDRHEIPVIVDVDEDRR